MKLSEIVLGENQALVPDIVKGIQEIATELNQNGTSLYRRELVMELNRSIPNLDLTDGRIIKSFIKEAYDQTPSPVIQNAISQCFIENAGDKPVYDPYKISDAGLSLTMTGDDVLDLKKFDQKTDVLKGALIKKRDAVAEIKETETSIDLLVPEDNFSLTGRTKVNDTFKYAKKVRDGYGNLIDQYKKAQQANLDLIKDFEFLRSELLNFREEVTHLLSEILSEDTRASHPELFEFSRIEYFNIEQFREKLNLAFDTLTQKMQFFNNDYNKKMLELKDAGISHADKALDRLSASKKRRGHVSRREVKGQVAAAALGFAFDAFLSISETRKNAEETVAQLKHDVEIMKLGLKGDTQIIVEDLLRLGRLHSRLKGVLIPGVRKFITEANNIFNSDIKNAYSEMVKGGTIGELSGENRKLVAEIKQIKLEIEDNNQGIVICEDEISKYQELIADIQFEYDYVNDIKPSEPNLFHTIISLGLAKTGYENHLADWTRITEPIRTEYGTYVNILDLEAGTLLRLKDVLKKLHNRLEEIEKQLEYNKIKIEEQTIKIEDFTPQFEAFKRGVNQLSAASKNFLEIGIAEELHNYSAHSQFSSDDFGISEVNSFPVSKNNDVTYLKNQQYKMELKVELLNYTESLFTGELVEKFGELGGEKLELFILEQQAKMRPYLTHKIQQKTKLNAEQASRLVNLGADVFVSILKTQKIKAETNFIKELNARLDQEFLERFEISAASFKLSLEKDQKEAETLNSALNGAMSTEDLLNASEAFRNN